MLTALPLFSNKTSLTSSKKGVCLPLIETTLSPFANPEAFAVGLTNVSIIIGILGVIYILASFCFKTSATPSLFTGKVTSFPFLRTVTLSPKRILMEAFSNLSAGFPSILMILSPLWNPIFLPASVTPIPFSNLVRSVYISPLNKERQV